MVWNGILLDGHHRIEICKRHDIAFHIVQRKFGSRDDAKEWVIRNQLARRNLNPWQYGRLVLALKPFITARAKEQQVEAGKVFGRGKEKVLATLPEPIDTRLELSRMAGLGERTMGKVMKIAEQELARIAGISHG